MLLASKQTWLFYFCYTPFFSTFDNFSFPASLTNNTNDHNKNTIFLFIYHSDVVFFLCVKTFYNSSEKSIEFRGFQKYHLFFFLLLLFHFIFFILDNLFIIKAMIQPNNETQCKKKADPYFYWGIMEISLNYVRKKNNITTLIRISLYCWCSFRFVGVHFF